MAIDLPKDLEIHALELAASGHYGSTVADVFRAALRALDAQAEAEEEEASLQVAADTAAISDYLTRGGRDPRDMTAAEAVVALSSDEPDKRRALGAHFQALCNDIDTGKVKRLPAREALARISAELGLD
jgi:Arc/MetJ-type ribon-helix-helix transcriptional regulator